MNSFPVNSNIQNIVYYAHFNKCGVSVIDAMPRR